MNKVLIVAPYQFGELTDCYYWAKYAVEEGWNVSYIGYKYKKRMIKERSCPGVNVIGVIHRNSRYLHGFIFLTKIIVEILMRQHVNIIICYFPYCEIIAKLFKKRNVILDIRTLSVSNNDEERKAYDNKLRKISRQFKTITVISKGVGEKIERDYKLLPLGAENLSSVVKEFDEMNLFYIGTLNNRNLAVFIEGLAEFQKQTCSKCTFDIIGGGSEEEENELMNAIRKFKAKNVVLHGYLTHEEAKPFFDKCNVGVCYVPMTDYYNHQPPTKMYEYLLSGMACIATKTQSNCEVMTEITGMVVCDDAKSVSEGLMLLYNNINTFSSVSILKNTEQYHWRTVVKKFFLPLFR